MRNALKRLGVGGRLLLAFLGISAFAAIVAVTGVVAFLEFSRVLDRITKEKVPFALAAQDISRQAGRIVAAAPVILTVADREQLALRSREIDKEMGKLEERIQALSGSDIELGKIWEISRQIRLNLLKLDTHVRGRLIKAAELTEALESAQQVHDEISQLLEPWILVTEARIAKWRDAVERLAPGSGERIAADRDLESALDWIHALQELQLLLTTLSENLQRFALSDDQKKLQLSSFRQTLLVRKASQLIIGLDPKLQPQISELLEKYNAFVGGPKSISGLRNDELEDIADARQTLQQNDSLSQQLVIAVDDLVAGAQTDIDEANAEAEFVQRASMITTVSVVVLSLICSALIVWLYVGRNLVARLTRLTDSMLAIADGDLKAPLPSVHGSDEIGRMAEALTVFRDTAVEVEENNLREIAETRRRLEDAIESTSEGFAFYDSEDRLELCNTRYKELLYPKLAANLTPGRKFEDIVREAAEAGLMPDAIGRIDEWVKERLELHRNAAGPHLHQLRGGLWVLISERRTSSGGIVAVYSDITELKTREEELTQKSAALEEKSRALEQLSTQLAKYLSPQVYDSIFTGEQEVRVESSRKKLTIFFSDIADFTETADRMESEELTRLLNQYLTEMSEIALEYGATIDKYVGDAVMVFFGDPHTKGVREDAVACVKMAMAMRDRLKELEKIWRRSGIERPLRSRIGIHTGYCTVGNFGSESRMDYTIIGGAVNTAARLESAARPGEILISFETFSQVRDEIHCREHGEIDVKGIAYPVATYLAVDTHDEAGRKKQRFREEAESWKVEIDLASMTPSEKRGAAKSLKRALRRLEGPKARKPGTPT